MIDGGRRPSAAWLETPEVRSIDPAALAFLRRGTGLRRLPHGTAVAAVDRGQGPRRVLAFDRHGVLEAGLRWRPDGRLAAGWVRCPDRSWLRIEPAATTDAPWGLSDRLWHGATPGLAPAAGEEALTVFEAMDWARIDRIPTMLDPTRVPPGGGTAVLNLIAALAHEQGLARIAYRGPYPGEQLFLALLESFRYVAPDGVAPLSAFARGDLPWVPAPHERVFPAEDLCVQLREGVEKVTWRGRTYYRPRWQEVERHAPRRVVDDTGGDGVRCVLWALGSVIEDHLRLRADGEILEALDPPPSPDAVEPLPAAVAPGVAEIVVASSAGPLAPFIRTEGARLGLTWGPIPGDLVRLEGDRAILSGRLRDVALRQLRAAGRETRATLALALLAEISRLVGDVLRARAQARLASLPPEAQARALAGPELDRDPQAPRRITLAVRALLEA